MSAFVAKVRRIDFYPDEFLGGISQLTCEARGALITVLSLIWSRGGPIEDNDAWLARMCAMSGRRWRSLRKDLIDAGKLTAKNGCLTNSRAERELERAMARILSAAENGRKGGRPRAEKGLRGRNLEAHDKATGLSRADGVASANHQPSTVNYQPAKREGLASERAEPVGELPSDGAPRRPDVEIMRWVPSPETVSWAAKLRPDLDLNQEIEKFKDYRLSRGNHAARISDFDASFRNWVRNAFSSGDSRRRNAASAAQRSHEIRAAAALRVASFDGMPAAGDGSAAADDGD